MPRQRCGHRQGARRQGREAGDGSTHLGRETGLVGVAKAVFDAAMPTANQIHRKRDDVNVRASDLLDFGPQTPITEEGLRTNINVALQYLASWLAGSGCVPINNLMEDAATAEISRSQVWQWIRSPRGVLEDGRKVTAELFRAHCPRSSRRRGLPIPAASPSLRGGGEAPGLPGDGRRFRRFPHRAGLLARRLRAAVVH